MMIVIGAGTLALTVLLSALVGAVFALRWRRK